MRTYGQFCPIAVGAEIFAERWTPLILRELYAGSHRFNDLTRGLPRIPRAVLVQRLRSLEAYGVIERRNGHRQGVGYYLTPAGTGPRRGGGRSGRLGQEMGTLRDWRP